MKTKNLNYAFNVEYYEDCDFEGKDDFTNKNRDLTAIGCGFSPAVLKGCMSFTLQTRYPGLLIGVGNSHGSGGEADIDLGFTFDYVTGCPYIPGSSVKGVLRSAFEHTDYIRAILNDEEIDAAELKSEIFDGCANGDELPVLKRDVFYDAFPTTKGTLMDMEAITPHGDDPTKNPIPLALIKVKSNVTFEFRFKLNDGLISAEKKLRLFKQIIIELGMGAKTNVGFGVFTDTNLPFDNAPTYAGAAAKAALPRTGQSKPVYVVCPTCGWRNFKYQKDTNNLTWAWKNGRCGNRSCGVDISGLINKVEKR